MVVGRRRVAAASVATAYALHVYALSAGCPFPRAPAAVSVWRACPLSSFLPPTGHATNPSSPIAVCAPEKLVCTRVLGYFSRVLVGATVPSTPPAVAARFRHPVRRPLLA